jgi:hypothetical protein
MTMRTLPLLVIAFAFAACSSKSEQHHAPQPVTVVVAPALADASQTALATELEAARARGTWSEVKRRWQGQTLHWTVTRQRALCWSAESCNVAAFPIQGGAKHGWLPQLVFAPGQFAALEAACGDREQCDVTIEGLLDRLEVSQEMPTNLHVSNVVIVSKTARR